MPHSFSKQGSLLTYLGVIPFWMSAVAVTFGFEPEKSISALLTYSAVIVAFISGSHWGLCVNDKEERIVWVLALSNLTALLAWGSLLLPNPISALLLIMFTLCILLYIDCKLYQRKKTQEWYIKLRWRVTLLVLLGLALALFSLLLNRY